MKKQDKIPPLLDHWTPPKLQDDDVSTITPIGFICTSFTFDADFFDDECLTRFLTMETEKESDGAAFLVEREEKLAGLRGGIVLVDQHHCKGGRSLRWDLVACRIKHGILHAKITILRWSHCIRLIVGSANLTPNGCCINQEIFAVFDYYNGCDEDLKLINDILNYLTELSHSQCGAIVQQRFDNLSVEIRQALNQWGISNKNYSRDEIRVNTLLVSPTNRNGIYRLKEIWEQSAYSPPDNAYVTSPFFDQEEHPNTPSNILPQILRQRGDACITYQLTVEPHSEEDNRLIAHAPSFLSKKSRPALEINFTSISEVGLNEEDKTVPRPLHLKTTWLQNDDTHLMMAGSSNFTSAAFGLGARVNYEANVVFTVFKNRNKKAYDQLINSHIDGDDLDSDKLIFREIPNEDEPMPDADEILLPAFFGEAVIRKVADRCLLEINFCSDDSPAGFEIIFEFHQRKEMLVNEDLWVQAGKKLKLEIEWNEPFVPDHLLVSWMAVNEYAFWPVITESQLTLPPVEALKNLSLEALLYILNSSQPLHRLLKGLEKLKGGQGQETDSVIDVHKLVDTSGFLLQRTRRISYAIRALVGRLEKPVFTEESLKWRLSGPVGVQALIDAISREAKSTEEKCFLLAELALELSRFQPKETDVSLKPGKVKAEIKTFIRGIQIDLNKEEINHGPIKDYSMRAIKKALHEF